MDCLNAQTRITAYVEGQLFGEERKEFLLHMVNCPGCREELEIYYTLMEATRQLDEGQLTTSDFMKELEDKIHTELEEIRAREHRVTQRRSLFMILLFSITLYAAIKIFDIPVPILNPYEKTTWEDQKNHISEYMIPYMYEIPTKPERLD